MKYYILLLSCCLGLPIFAQQDPLLSQYQFNQITINPAYTGVNDISSIDMQYRSHWNGVEGAPSTLLFSGQTSIVNNTVGLGVVLIHDQLGIVKNTDFNLDYSYELPLNYNNLSLSIGLQTGISAIRYDFNELNIQDPTDEDFSGANNRLSQVNFGTGIFLSNEKFYFGLSIPRILKAKEEVAGVTAERYNRHYYVSAGVVFDQFESIALKPYAVLRMAENSPSAFDLGISGRFAERFWAGVFSRDFRDIGLSVYMNLVNGLRLGYAGELTSNEITSGFNTHEFSLGFDLGLLDYHKVERRNY